MPIPDGYTTVTPWIISKDTIALMEWLTAAFGAEEIARVVDDNGVVGHAEMRIGNAIVMMFDARPDWPPTPAFLRLYVEDADEVHRQAVAAGGTSVTEVTELFFGDKVGRVRDPFGNLYWVQTRLHDLTEEETYARMVDPEFVKAMEYVSGSDFFPRRTS
ncbi:putative glyoxalase superfamily protein PhnB [Kribbella sp. VKM Ac-2527]|uniref:Putative glyoxalase superfamily protein PhnB n=1 Tax=Kribbella caucasensis TaxID=2512215 RepID=A0A4R6K261_9ACTN|nr:VOC family protein [Kribbella sp. VKM Ac-2527]TDO43294.1 putative glyoxalase superfamily protein PhnB [Kribbella sp. VKM Ac-2527]